MLANKKINTRLEFPHFLDLKEYTLEYLENHEKQQNGGSLGMPNERPEGDENDSASS